jgi:SAM-dependent methyltransferase
LESPEPMSEPARQRLDFRHRSHEQEWLDRDDIDPAELRAVLRDLARFNTAFFGHSPILKWLGRVLGRDRNGSDPAILDVGCGYGDLLRAIRGWSNKRNLKPALLGVDLNPETIRIAREATDQADQIDFAVMDAFDLPPGRRFDIIVSSLVAHHLSDEKLRDFLVLLERASTQGWLIYDLQRHRVLYEVIGLASRLARLHPMITNDGQISVMRSLTRKEWTDRLAASGIELSNVKIRWFLFRFVIERRKVFPPGTQ